MLIAEYFVSVEQALGRNRHITSLKLLISQASDDYNGLLRVRAHFWDDSYLDIYKVAATALGYPIRVHYAYAYVSGDRHIFRYDNAPHHPELFTHPHHKHVGTDERAVPSEQPSPSQVLAEITDILTR